MAIQIETKIVDYSVRKGDEEQQSRAPAANEAEQTPAQDNVVQLHEKLEWFHPLPGANPRPFGGTPHL